MDEEYFFSKWMDVTSGNKVKLTFSDKMIINLLELSWAEGMHQVWVLEESAAFRFYFSCFLSVKQSVLKMTSLYGHDVVLGTLPLYT